MYGYLDKVKVHALAVILICVAKKSIHPLPRYEFFQIPPPKNGTFENEGKTAQGFQKFKKGVSSCKNHDF